jgi:hypothetical protein
VRGDEVMGGSWRRRGSALLLGALHTLLCRANGRETHVHVGPTSQLTYFPFFLLKLAGLIPSVGRTALEEVTIAIGSSSPFNDFTKLN